VDNRWITNRLKLYKIVDNFCQAIKVRIIRSDKIVYNYIIAIILDIVIFKY